MGNQRAMRLRCAITCAALVTLTAGAALAQGPKVDRLAHDLGGTSGADLVPTLKLAIALATLSVIPALLMVTTAFMRIIIVLSFLRGAMGTQTIPPTSVLTGLALFITFFVMSPTWNEVQATAIAPYNAGSITFQQAVERGQKPLQSFMLRQTRDRDLLLFVQLAGIKDRPPKEQLPFRVVAPAFMTSELRTAFEIGLILYIPFLVIDLVVASSLMSMGMMMVPPMAIALPLKILLFIMADGWTLLVKSVVVSFL
jgi:flagellar biosynthesis protein FliP